MLNGDGQVLVNDTRQSPGTAILIDQLRPQRPNTAHHRAGCETWACCWSPDGSYFAWSCGNHIVKLIPWDRHRHCTVQNTSDANDSGSVATTSSFTSKVHTLDTGQLVWAVAFGSDQPHTVRNTVNLGWSSSTVVRPPLATDRSSFESLLILATGLQNGRIKTWNARTGTLLAELEGHTEVIRDLSYSPDGRLMLASASRDSTIKIWDGHSSCLKATLTEGESKWMYGCCWAPNSALLASVGDSKSVIVWDMLSLKCLRKLIGHQMDVCGCDFSPDGALLATSSYDARVIVWDVYLGTQLMELRHTYAAPTLILVNHDAYIRAVSFSRDGRHIATVSDDGYIRFWDIFNRDLPTQVATVTTPLCCRFSPDGAVLAVGTRNGIVTMWMSPMQVSSLQHICRLAIRRLLPSDKLSSLTVPDRLRKFLAYELHW